jgi:hypothetical protein
MQKDSNIVKLARDLYLIVYFALFLFMAFVKHETMSSLKLPRGSGFFSSITYRPLLVAFCLEFGVAIPLDLVASRS